MDYLFPTDLDVDLPIVLLLSLPFRSPIRTTSKQPRNSCSLPTPPSTPQAALTETDELLLAEELDSQERGRLADKLDIEDRTMMHDLMSSPCSREHCLMAGEVVSLIIPAAQPNSRISLIDRVRVTEAQTSRIAEMLEHWCGLSEHPLCTLITTVILVTRVFALHPTIGSSVLSSDASLRLTFAAWLVALQLTSEESYENRSFLPYTSWTLPDISLMEREFLANFLRWDVYISSEEFLHRAAGFYRPTPPCSPKPWDSCSFADLPPSSTFPSPPPTPTSVGNLFLMQKRIGTDERGWKGGIVRSPGEEGTRMSEAGGAFETVWNEAGRLERTGSGSAGRISRSGSVSARRPGLSLQRRLVVRVSRRVDIC